VIHITPTNSPYITWKFDSDPLFYVTFDPVWQTLTYGRLSRAITTNKAKRTDLYDLVRIIFFAEGKSGRK
jgi:hypothetical protein